MPARRWRWRRGAALVAALCLALVALVAPVAAATTAATASQIAAAIAGPGAVVTGASYVTTTGGTPNGVSDAPLAGFGTAGNSFGILTTGSVGYVATPTAIANSNNGGTVAGRGDTARDISVLRVGLRVPQGANCLTFDFKFLSTEYPGYVNQDFNDAFIAELDSSTWTTSGATISALNNFAFDTAGKVVSVNALGLGGFSAAQGAGTPFNGTKTYPQYLPDEPSDLLPSGNVGGATGLLRASTQIAPGDHAVYFSIFDQADNAFDSAVFLDNLVVGFVPDPATNCKPGAQPASYKLTLTPTTGTAPVGTAHTVTATLTDAVGTPVANVPVGFSVTGANAGGGTVATNGSGQAAFTYTGPNLGTDQIAACYRPAGATACLAQAAAQQTWAAAATTLTVGSATGTYGGSATLTATLTQGGNPLASQTVAFTLNGNPAGTATTGADGVATLTPPANLGTTPVGTYPSAIGAMFAATSNYLDSNGTGALTVTPVTLAVTADSQIKVVGAPNPPLTATIAGFVNGETLATSGVTGSPALSTTATAASPVGTYPITAAAGTLAAANYTFTFANGTLSVQYAASCATGPGRTVLQPINADGTSVFKQGSTVPVKFRVCDASGVAIGTPGLITDFRLVKTNSGTTSTTVNEPVDSTTPDSAFRWSGDQWIFNLNTKPLTVGATYTYRITLNDGSTITFSFGLK